MDLTPWQALNGGSNGNDRGGFTGSQQTPNRQQQQRQRQRQRNQQNRQNRRTQINNRQYSNRG